MTRKRKYTADEDGGPTPKTPRVHRHSFHQGFENFELLAQRHPPLAKYVYHDRGGVPRLDFGDASALRELSAALLAVYYHVHSWALPSDGRFLIPPVPSRADYIHVLAELLTIDGDSVARGKAIRGLDIGVGGNCIYPLIGNKVYGWRFLGTDISEESLECAKEIVTSNNLEDSIELRLNPDRDHIFDGVIENTEMFSFCMCNPPFHSDIRQAFSHPRRALEGRGEELLTEGGELNFITKMINESTTRHKQILWYSSLVARLSTLKLLTRRIHALPDISIIREFCICQAKQARWIVAWSFHLQTEIDAAISSLNDEGFSVPPCNHPSHAHEPEAQRGETSDTAVQETSPLKRHEEARDATGGETSDTAAAQEPAINAS